jgi:hypothetical protein
VLLDAIEAIAARDSRFGGFLRSRVRSIERDARAAAEVELGSEPAAALLPGVGSQGASELLLELYGIRERFFRRTEVFGFRAEELTAWLTEQYENMTLAFLGRQFDLIRDDLRGGYNWYSGIEDAGRQLGSSAKQVWERAKEWANREFPDAKFETSVERAGWEDTTLERLFRRHLRQEVRDRFGKTLQAELDGALQRRWAEVARSACDAVGVPWSVAGVTGGGEAPGGLPMDDASKVALGGVAAAATATVVLAAGWHTLAWSFGGVFLPMLPVLAAASIGTAVLTKQRALERLLEKIDEQQRDVEQSIRESVRYRLRSEIGKANRETATRFRTAIFSSTVGTFEPTQLDRVVRCLEDWVEELATRIRGSAGAQTADCNYDWLGRARVAEQGGDEFAAAMYGGLAFEQLLRDVNRRAGLGFDFRVAHHNYLFLEKLTGSGRLPDETVAILRSLKSRRDTYTHRMFAVAALSEASRKKNVVRYLADLERARRECVP